MKFNPQTHHRRSIRLNGYDYARENFYFITICCQNKVCLFGEIQNGGMLLNDAGKMLEYEWLMLEARFQNIKLQSFVVMPNHFHGILEIVGATLVVAQNNGNETGRSQAVAQNNGNETGQPQGTAPTKSIGDMLDAFKSITTVKYIHGVKNFGWPSFDKRIWQRNYYEHIIRDESEYLKIVNYIENNPAKWAEDDFHA